jgi:predicted dehydrogenase
MSESPTLRTAVIGVGYLGRFHAEKYYSLEHSNLVAVVDTHQQQAKEVAARFQTQPLNDYRELIGQVDAVSIVTPTSLHYAIARELLEAGIHLLVEKPITVSVQEADELVRLAQQNNVILQVGHLERFNSAMLDLDKVLNNPRFIETHRLAPFKPRATDVDVILDLMIHDIDIILSIVRSDVVDIAVSGTEVLSNSTDIANARLSFENGCVANITASRISLKSERKMRIFQSDAYLSVDFQNRIFSYHRKGTDEMYPGVPAIESQETEYQDGDALKAEIEHFIHCIRHNGKPLVAGEDGLRALQVATQVRELLETSQGVQI